MHVNILFYFIFNFWVYYVCLMSVCLFILVLILTCGFAMRGFVLK